MAVISIANSHPLLAVEYDDDQPIEKVGSGYSKKIRWRCPAGHGYLAFVHNRISGQGCPDCRLGPLLIDELPALVPMLTDENPPLESIRAGRAAPLNWLLPCGHHRRTTISMMLREDGCHHCENRRFLPGYNPLAVTDPDLASEWSNNNEIPATEVFRLSQESRLWRCRTCSHEFRTSPSVRVRKGTGCPACVGNVITPGINDFRTLLNLPPGPINGFVYTASNVITEDMVGLTRSVLWECERGHEVRSRAAYIASGQVRCPCSPRSRGEIEIAEFVASLPGVGEITRNSRSIIAPYELDIVVPDLGVAIEFNGDHWHSDAVLLDAHGLTAVDYHSMKVRLCETVGYRLAFVWDSDWLRRRVAVEDALTSFLGGGTHVMLSRLS